jgi:reactive intermediate/imine deaminase
MNQNLTRPLATYVHTRRIGSLIFVAGQGCRSPKTDQCVGLTKDANGRITQYDIVAQTRGVLDNIERALGEHQCDRRHILDVTVFLKDMKDFSEMNKVWNEFFADSPPPTRTTVAVADLPGENFVEMKAIASAAHPEGGNPLEGSR